MASEWGSERRAPPWLPEALWIAASAGVYLFVVTAAWHGSLDPITDTGRDLYIPEQIRAGDKLYRDVLYFYPPLTPYLLAAVTSLTGSSLNVYAAFGSAIALLTAVAVYLLGRSTGGVHVAGAATLLFVAGSIYGSTGRTMNYLIPYAYAATLGMLFLLAGVASFALFLFVQRRAGWAVAAVLFLLASSWTKVEYAAFSLVVLLVAVAYRFPLRWVGGYAAGAVVSFIAVHLYFADAPAEQHWLWHNVLPSSLLQGESARYFYRQVAGFTAPGANLARAAGGALLAVAVAALIRWADRSRRISVHLAVAALSGLAALAWDGAFTRGWALLQFAVIPFAVRRRDPLLLLTVLSICASSRVILNLIPYWYGFVFIIPSGIWFTYVAFEWLPARDFYSRRAALLWIIPVVVLSGQFFAAGQRVLAWKQYPVFTDRGLYYDASPARAAVLNSFLQEIDLRRPESLLVVPEGLTLNYLVGVRNPLAFHTFTPPETADPQIEQQIISQLLAREPDLIAIVPRSVSDFGYRGFGIDYNRDLAATIRARYSVVKEWRLPGSEMVLLERNAGRP